jgi:hypothetical protein
VFTKIDETIAVGGVQLLLQGGHNPIFHFPGTRIFSAP